MIEREYGINPKPDSSGNPQVNTTIEIIHQVLGNLVQTYNLHDTYVDNADPWMEILAADSFVVRSTYHRTKIKSLVQLVFGRYMTTPINNIAD